MSKIRPMHTEPWADDRQRPRHVSDKEWDERYSGINFKDGVVTEADDSDVFCIIMVDNDTGIEHECKKEGVFDTFEDAEARAMFMNRSWLLSNGCTYKAVPVGTTKAA